MKNKVFLIVLTTLAIGTLVILSYRENGVKTYPSYKTSSMSGFRLTHKENDEIRWELMAEKATFPEGNKEVFLDDLNMRILHDRDIALSGGSGIYNINNKTLVINKPIEIDIEGAILTTDSLLWNGQSRILSTEEHIRFQDKNFLIEGTGLNAVIKDQQIRILKNVKGTFYH
jgi:LPS export ABC transporter protein LptC